MTLRFLAGAMGVPFLPTRSSLGTDIIDKWGFSEAMRKEDPKIPDRKLNNPRLEDEGFIKGRFEIDYHL
jgi:acyl CoA:acetate/3-ketoacid CoA transferase alpha subunit